MFKIVVFLLGVTAGAAGATGWLLGEVPEPEGAEHGIGSILPSLRQAVAYGERAGGRAEARLHRELDAYRTGSLPGRG
ncbi:MAG: hypothetical protein ACRDFS_08750 [Chloroflexota bacterium]